MYSLLVGLILVQHAQSYDYISTQTECERQWGRYPSLDKMYTAYSKNVQWFNNDHRGFIYDCWSYSQGPTEDLKETVWFPVQKNVINVPGTDKKYERGKPYKLYLHCQAGWRADIVTINGITMGRCYTTQGLIDWTNWNNNIRPQEEQAVIDRQKQSFERTLEQAKEISRQQGEMRAKRGKGGASSSKRLVASGSEAETHYVALSTELLAEQLQCFDLADYSLEL